MTLRVLLVDDEPLALERLRVGLRDMPEIEIVGAARNGRDALAQIDSRRPDLVILDIQMPDGTGIEVARALAGRDPAPEVFFVTAYDSFAAEAFEVDASDYLLKPIRLERLRLAVDRARRRLRAREDGDRIRDLELVVEALRDGQKRSSADQPVRYETELWAPRAGGLTRIPVETIHWIEAARDYVLIHTAHRSFIIRETMSSLGDRLDPSLILRAHRSAFVNRMVVKAVERAGRGGLRLTLEGDVEVPVGLSYRAGVLSGLGADIPALRTEAQA